VSRIAVLGRVVASAAVLAVLIGVAVGVLAGSHPAAPEGVVQCSTDHEPAVAGCPEQAPAGR
jgi:hypothetical protein